MPPHAAPVAHASSPTRRSSDLRSAPRPTRLCSAPSRPRSPLRQESPRGSRWHRTSVACAVSTRPSRPPRSRRTRRARTPSGVRHRSEEHTSELQSRGHLVCLLTPPPSLTPRRLHDALPICDQRHDQHACALRRPGHDHRSDKNHPVDRVGTGHQWRVQCRRDLRDHLEADEHGEHEHRQECDTFAHEVTSTRISPAWVTQAAATISSSKSGASCPPSPVSKVNNATRLPAYKRLACTASWLGTFCPPHSVALPTMISSPGRLPSTFPPDSAARSTTTLPGFIRSTADLSTSSGACLPGTAAVVMRTSDSATCSANKSRCIWARSSVISRAYPPEPSKVGRSSSTKAAPRLRTSSADADRTS